MSVFRHGTPHGANMHSAAGEKACDACAAAKAKYDRDWRSASHIRKRSRLHAKAQQQALAALRRAHPDEYKALYALIRDRLFAEHADEITPPTTEGDPR